MKKENIICLVMEKAIGLKERIDQVNQLDVIANRNLTKPPQIDYDTICHSVILGFLPNQVVTQQEELRWGQISHVLTPPGLILVHPQIITHPNQVATQADHSYKDYCHVLDLR